MGYAKRLRAVETVEDFEAMKECLPLWRREDLPVDEDQVIFGIISHPPILRACLRHFQVKGVFLERDRLMNIFYIVAYKHRIELIDVFFTEDLVTIGSLTGTDPFFKYIRHIAREGYVDVMEFFLDKGMSPDLAGGFTQKSILFTACSSCTIDIVSLLLLRGANANFNDMHDYTPLFSAINKPNVRILDNLIMYGADLYYRRDGNNVWNYVSIHIYHEEAMKENFQRLVEFDVPVSKKTYRYIKRHVHGLPGLPMLLSMMQKVVDKIGFYENDPEDDAVEDNASEDHAMEEE